MDKARRAAGFRGEYGIYVAAYGGGNYRNIRGVFNRGFIGFLTLSTEFSTESKNERPRNIAKNNKKRRCYADNPEKYPPLKIRRGMSEYITSGNFPWNFRFLWLSAGNRITRCN